MHETENIDKIAGLFTQLASRDCCSDHFIVNYYPTYDYCTGSFDVDVCVTLYSDQETIKALFPDIADKLINYYCNNHYPSTTLELTDKEKSFIFEQFKKYCVHWFEQDGCKNFDDVISYVNSSQ